MAQYQNNPIIFGTPSLPPRPAAPPATSPNVFLFAPLGGYNYNTQTPLPSITYPPSTPPSSNNWSSGIYPPATGGGNVFGPIIFQPSSQPSVTTSTPGMFQPVPGQTLPNATPGGGGGLISQTVPQPILTPSSTMSTPTHPPQIGGWDNTCGISRGTTNRVVGGVEAKKGKFILKK